MVQNRNVADCASRLLWLQCVDSTNRYAINHFEELADFTFVVAEEQTAGRGRRGKDWHSPVNTNFYGSLVIKKQEYQPFQLVWPGSLAALELLRSYMPEKELWLKWPNDIFCGNRKIAGTLCEARFVTRHTLAGIVFGIGINLNMDETMLEAIDRPATSILIETGNKVNLKKFAFELGNKTSSLYSTAFSFGLENFYRLWKKENRLLGNKIEVLTDKEEIISGTVIDINAGAELVLRTEDGVIHNLSSGDVSIKKGFCLC